MVPGTGNPQKLRYAIVDNIEESEEIVYQQAIVKDWPGWITSAGLLKNIPKGWPSDHPQFELQHLRYFGKFHK